MFKNLPPLPYPSSRPSANCVSYVNDSLAGIGTHLRETMDLRASRLRAQHEHRRTRAARYRRRTRPLSAHPYVSARLTSSATTSPCGGTGLDSFEIDRGQCADSQIPRQQPWREAPRGPQQQNRLGSAPVRARVVNRGIGAHAHQRQRQHHPYSEAPRGAQARPDRDGTMERASRAELG